MSEVVRRRLELLLAEVQPRHALGGASSTVDVAGPDTGGPAPPDHVGEESAGGEQPDQAHPAGSRADPRRLLEPVGGLAVRLRVRVLEFGREHLAAVVVVLLVGCAWTAYSLFQARSTPVAVAAPPSVVTSPTPSPTPTPQVLVHVLGAVREPGIVRLDAGSRVADALAAAGGLADSADPGELNLAAVVADGSQVVIGTRSKPKGEVRATENQAGAGEANGSGTVSLNTATLEQLDTLPGVGPVTAQKILDWREQHGRFSTVSELQEVAGIGPKTYADIAPHVRV